MQYDSQGHFLGALKLAERDVPYYVSFSREFTERARDFEKGLF